MDKKYNNQNMCGGSVYVGEGGNLNKQQQVVLLISIDPAECYVVK